MDRTYYQTLMVPAGTPIGAPVSQAMPLEDANLAQIVITIPDGPNGNTGVRVLIGNQQVIPWANNLYLVANNRTITLPFDQPIGASGVVLMGYNLGIYPHTFYFEVTIADLPLPVPSMAAATVSAIPDATVAAQTIDPLSADALIASLPDTTDPNSPTFLSDLTLPTDAVTPTPLVDTGTVSPAPAQIPPALVPVVWRWEHLSKEFLRDGKRAVRPSGNLTIQGKRYYW